MTGEPVPKGPQQPVPSLPPFPLNRLTGLPIFSAFLFREFRLLWGAQLGNALGINMDLVARGWLMYDLTGSTLDLGLVSAVKILPSVFLGPVAGVLADRGNRKFQLITAQTLNAIMNFLLAWLILSGRIEVWHVYATGFVVAIVQVFEIPARQSMLPESVDAARLTNAIGLQSVAFNISQSLGPALAGLLVAISGPGGSYIAQGLIYAFSTVWTVQLRLRERISGDLDRPRSSILRGMVEGWRYVFHHASIRSGMTVITLIRFAGMSMMTLIPAFARDILDVGPQGQGLLTTAVGVGALGGAFFIAAMGDRLPKGKIMLAGGMIYGVGELAFGASHWFGLSVLLMFGLGLTGVSCTTLVNTVLQRAAAPDMRGRVMSMFQQSQISYITGGVVIGAVAEVLGPGQATMLMGLVCAVGFATMAIALADIRAVRQ